MQSDMEENDFIEFEDSVKRKRRLIKELKFQNNNTRDINPQNEEIMSLQDKTVDIVDNILERERDKNNTYSSHKSVSVQFRTTDVILYYFGIIYIIISSHPDSKNYNSLEITIICLLIIGLAIQFLIGFLTFLLLKTSRDNATKNCSATKLNDIVMALSGLSTILNGALNTLYSGGVASGVLNQIGNNTATLVR